MRILIAAVFLAAVLAGCTTPRPRFSEAEQRNLPHSPWGFARPPRPESPRVVKTEVVSVQECQSSPPSYDISLKIVDGKVPGSETAREFEYHTLDQSHVFRIGQSLTFVFAKAVPLYGLGALHGVDEIVPVYPGGVPEALKPWINGAELLQNPKQLVPPLKLIRADYYMDGGSLGGTLGDSRGQRLDFFFDRGLRRDLARERGVDLGCNIYIGFTSGVGIDSKKARFDGWKEEDLYSVIEDTIRRQFVWDPAAKTLRPREPDDPLSREISKDRGLFRAPDILKYVEWQFHRKSTYMPGR